MPSSLRNNEHQDADPSRASLFTLGTELRWQIYALILPVMENDLVVALRSDSFVLSTVLKTTKEYKDLITHPLRRVCRALRNDLMGYISGNRFFGVYCGYRTYLGPAWARALGSINVRIIQKLVLSFPEYRLLTWHRVPAHLLPEYKGRRTGAGKADTVAERALLRIRDFTSIRRLNIRVPCEWDQRTTDAVRKAFFELSPNELLHLARFIRDFKLEHPAFESLYIIHSDQTPQRNLHERQEHFREVFAAAKATSEKLWEAEQGLAAQGS